MSEVSTSPEYEEGPMLRRSIAKAWLVEIGSGLLINGEVHLLNEIDPNFEPNLMDWTLFSIARNRDEVADFGTRYLLGLKRFDSAPAATRDMLAVLADDAERNYGAMALLENRFLETRA